jgi:hypothetical protein
MEELERHLSMTIKDLEAGQVIKYKDRFFLITCDFKHGGDRLCIDFISGSPLWIKPDTQVEKIDCYAYIENELIKISKE